MGSASWQKLKDYLHPRLSYFKDESWKIVAERPYVRGAIIVLGLFFFLVCLAILWNLAPSEIGCGERRKVEIPRGLTLREASRILESRGIIRNRYVFEFFVRLSPKRPVIKSGRYLLGPGMAVPRIAEELQLGTPGQIRVTIPEGLTNREIAALLAEKGLVREDLFLRKLRDRHFLKSVAKFLPVAGTVEGFLYPDTYYFSVEDSTEGIILTMLRRFDEVYRSRLPEVSPMELNKVVIVASIVEKEAREAVERPVIAGVFYNRMRRGYPLQSCATVQYALGKHKGRLFYQDLQVDSLYNTYRYRGLPPGPIANPGLASLKAAAHPAKVSFLYFVAKPDGYHIFSDTFARHIQAQREINN